MGLPLSKQDSANDRDAYMTHSDGVEHEAHEKISGWKLGMTREPAEYKLL